MGPDSIWKQSLRDSLSRSPNLYKEIHILVTRHYYIETPVDINSHVDMLRKHLSQFAVGMGPISIYGRTKFYPAIQYSTHVASSLITDTLLKHTNTGGSSLVKVNLDKAPWWRHQIEAFPALLALSPVTGEFPSQRASNAEFDVALMWVRMSC